MKTFPIICTAMIAAATLAIFVFLPPTVTLKVGDPSSRVNEVARYGYGKSIFSVYKADSDGHRLEPAAFLIGPNGGHLMVWHNERIVSMMHFRFEPVPNTYGHWHDIKNVESFTFQRPSLVPYFVGLVIIGLAGFLLARFRRISMVAFVVLIIFAGLMVLTTSVLAGAFAFLPALFVIGWVFAAMLGWSLSQASGS